MHILIVDDEEHPGKLLVSLISKELPDASIHRVTSVKDALNHVEEQRPDLLFLDIQMPGENGFDFLEKAGAKLSCPVIFVTAYDQFALKAIKYSAADYLLKPVDLNELRAALNKVNDHAGGRADRMKNLLSNIAGNHPKKLAIPDTEGIFFVDVDKIIRCESEGNYTYIILQEGKKFLSSKTLGEYEELLADGSFYRVHRSHLVNLQQITRYIRGEGGYVELADGSKVEVSRRRKQEFLERLGNR